MEALERMFEDSEDEVTTDLDELTEEEEGYLDELIEADFSDEEFGILADISND